MMNGRAGRHGQAHILPRSPPNCQAAVFGGGHSAGGRTASHGQYGQVGGQIPDGGSSQGEIDGGGSSGIPAIGTSAKKSSIMTSEQLLLPAQSDDVDRLMPTTHNCHGQKVSNYKLFLFSILIINGSLNFPP